MGRLIRCVSQRSMFLVVLVARTDFVIKVGMGTGDGRTRGGRNFARLPEILSSPASSGQGAGGRGRGYEKRGQVRPRNRLTHGSMVLRVSRRHGDIFV